MGVAYTHGVFVRDLNWRPTWEHVEAVRRVLERWGFDASPGEMYMDLSEGGADVVDDAEAPSLDKLMLHLGGPEGARAAELMGPSAYPDLEDEARYIISAEVVFSSDFAVLEWIEGEEVEVTTPPTTDGQAVDAEEDHSAYPAVARVYVATWQSTPPSTDAEGWCRVWRSGLLLECDKDVPAIAESRAGINERFLRELEAAFGTPLVELGWHH